MHCGVLLDQNGKVKRTWTLMNLPITIPVEDGDQIIEWDVDHGETTNNPADKLALIRTAVKEQEQVGTLTSRDAVLAHSKKYQRDMVTQTVVIAHPPVDPIYYGMGKGLHHRSVDADGDVQEVAVHPSNTLQMAE